MKRFSISIAIMGILSFFTTMLGCSPAEDGFKSVAPDDFEKCIADTSVVRLDVRTAEEYSEGHIERTKNIDVLKSDFEKKSLEILPKDKTIALYCRSGRRSKEAAKILSKNGYKVVELNTGYIGWTEAGKPVTK